MFAENSLPTQQQSHHASNFFFIKPAAFVYPGILVVLLSVIALAVNHFFYQYPGNVYFPPDCILVGLNLSLMYAGFFLLQGRDGKITKRIKDVMVLVVVMGVLALATNAAQYTPFPTIDRPILAFETFLHIDTKALIIWTHERPLLKKILEALYSSLDYQMCYIPLIVILIGRTGLIREYYFLLMMTVFIGFTGYYFFPTTAPASIMDGDYFSEMQRATSHKFFQIHHFTQPDTMAGGLVSMPSFHVIWAWLCLRLVRTWPMAFGVLLPMNTLLIAACVLLGWHYCVDIAASFIVIGLAHGLQRWMSAIQR